MVGMIFGMSAMHGKQEKHAHKQKRDQAQVEVHKSSSDLHLNMEEK